MILDDLGEFFTFQTFDDSPQKRKKLVTILHGTLEQHKETLERLNDQGAGIFFTVNQTDQGGRGISNVKRVRALFVDFDTVDRNRSFDDYELPPSAVIESSPGKHHAYWGLEDDLPLNQFKSYQLGLAEFLGSDPKICDLPRVMRVPGFWHRKAEPFRVKQIWDTGLTYKYSEIRDWAWIDDYVEPAKKIIELEKTAYVRDDPDAVSELNRLLSDLRAAEQGNRNNTLNKIAYRVLGLAAAGRLYRPRVVDDLREVAIEIGLSQDEAEATIRSARQKAPPVINPINKLEELPEFEDDIEDLITGESEKKLDSIHLIRGSDVEIENISWMWHGWLARGKIHILGGEPSTGKTTLCLSLAATLTRGGVWPDGTPCIRRRVLIWSGEDDPETTLVPRLIMSGADLDYVHFIKAVKEKGKMVPFDPSIHMPKIKQAFDLYGDFGLFIVDPVISAVSGDSHKNNDVRRGLQPLVDLAQNSNCAVIGIGHLTKGTQGRNPLERLTGSIAFAALARLMFYAVKIENEDGTIQRVVVRAKSNISKDTGGFEYVIDVGHIEHGSLPIETTSVVWGGAVEGTAGEVMHSADQTAEERSDLEVAKQFLRDYLEDGPRSVKPLIASARSADIPQVTLKRAKRALKIIARRQGFGATGEWEWVLPEHVDNEIMSD